MRGKKQFCPKGHDTFVVGRWYSGRCKECSKYVPVEIDHRIKPFCPKGHDKDVVGRVEGGGCAECRKGIDKNRREAIRDGVKIVEHTKQICIKGHDTLICGRYKDGKCVECVEEYYLLNKQEMDLKHAEYKEEHKEELKIKAKEWREENKEELKIKAKQQFERHREKRIAYQLEYIKKHPEKKRASEKKCRTKKRKEDICYKLQEKLRSRIHSAIKKNVKKGSAVRDLGCSILFFKDYIESQFTAGMTWANWGKVWQLDHIIPLWKFDLTDATQFKQAVYYTNMQPLTKAEHKKKTSEEAKERSRLKKEGKRV